jgi:hypothetical protein
MSLANIIGGIIFGSIGFIAFVYGKKMASFKPMVIGAALLVFPYLVSDARALYAIGAALTVSLFFFKD